MSFAVLIAIMLGRKIGLQNRILLQQALNQTNIGGVIRLAKALFLFSFYSRMYRYYNSFF